MACLNETDRAFMTKALKLARQGLGLTRPNPAVGAVVVRDGKVIGRGWHRKAGTPHAEVHALNDAGKAARGASLYVTLEPCNHTGRTPPCTHAILDAGINRVIIGALDPNPSVKGGGMAFLQDQGLEVIEGCLRHECRMLIAPFAKHSRTGIPWIRTKVACSMDGRTATRTGHSQWITNSAARFRGHELRRISDAILVGRGTVDADNPSLTCRDGSIECRDPVRIILDSSLSTDLESTVYVQSSPADTVVAAVKGLAPDSRVSEFQDRGVKVLLLPDGGHGTVDLHELVRQLGGMGIQSLLVEGGAAVHGSFRDAGLVDEVFFFYAPIILGGEEARPAVAGLGAGRLEEALGLCRFFFEELDGNWLISGNVTDLDEIWG